MLRGAYCTGVGQLAQSHKSLLEEDNDVIETVSDGGLGDAAPGLIAQARELLVSGKNKWQGLSRKKKIAILIGIFGGLVVGMSASGCG